MAHEVMFCFQLSGILTLPSKSPWAITTSWHPAEG